MSGSGATLDAGALIGIERGTRPMTVLLVRARERATPLVVPAGALAQAWRDGATQVRLARFLSSGLCEVAALDERAARSAGRLCSVSGTSDVVDASVVVVARQRALPVVTSDPEDLRRLDPHLRIVRV